MENVLGECSLLGLVIDPCPDVDRDKFVGVGDEEGAVPPSEDRLEVGGGMVSVGFAIDIGKGLVAGSGLHCEGR